MKRINNTSALTINTPSLSCYNAKYMTIYLGDNCIAFGNFTASIGDLMVAN